MSFPEPQMVIACIRSPERGAAVLREAARTARSRGVPLRLLSIQPLSLDDEERSRRVEAVYALSRVWDAEMDVRFSDSPVLTAAQLLCRRSAVLFTGLPSDSPDSFVVLLHRLLPELMISMVSGEGITYRLYPHAAAPALEVPGPR